MKFDFEIKELNTLQVLEIGRLQIVHSGPQTSKPCYVKFKSPFLSDKAEILLVLWSLHVVHI